MVRSHTVKTFPPHPNPSPSTPGQEGTCAMQVFKDTRRGGGTPLFLPSLYGQDWLGAAQFTYSSLSTQEGSCTWILGRQPVQTWPLKYSRHPFTHSPLLALETRNKGLRDGRHVMARICFPAQIGGIRPTPDHNTTVLG